MKPPGPVLFRYAWPDVGQLGFNTSIKARFKLVYNISVISYTLLLANPPPHPPSVVQKRTSCPRTDTTKWVQTKRRKVNSELC